MHLPAWLHTNKKYRTALDKYQQLSSVAADIQSLCWYHTPTCRSVQPHTPKEAANHPGSLNSFSEQWSPAPHLWGSSLSLCAFPSLITQSVKSLEHRPSPCAASYHVLPVPDSAPLSEVSLLLGQASAPGDSLCSQTSGLAIWQLDIV